MSSFGLAQFGLAAANAYAGAEDKRKAKEEADADKLYERGRQQKSDQRAEQTERRTQENHQIQYEGLKRDATAEEQLFKTAQDARDLTTAVNKVATLQASNDHMGALDVITNTTNKNSRATWKIGVERDANNSPIVTYDENGEATYQQNVYDKVSGEILSTAPMTLNDMMNSLGKLNNAQEMSAANAAAAAKRAATVQEMQDEKNGYIDKKITELAYETDLDGAKTTNDGILDGVKTDNQGWLEGVKNGFQTTRDATLHGYNITESNNDASNRVGVLIAADDVRSGGTPIVGGGNGGGPSWGSFDALIGPESNGQQLDSKGRPLTSSAGAIGIAQVMPDTAKYVANKHGIAWDANKYKTDPSYNYNLGKLYYQEQLDTFGHPALAYAAYNAGPGAVRSWIKKNPAMANPDTMGIDNFVRAIPFKETKNYVAKIHRQSNGSSGGIYVPRSVPHAPKTTKGAAVKTVNNTVDVGGYDDAITKGLVTAQKTIKDKGIKLDVASSATLANTATLLRKMARANNRAEYEELFKEAYASAQSVVPDNKMKKLNKGQRKALVGQIIYGIAGVSSLSELNGAIARFNPAIAQGERITQGLLPGQQARGTGSQLGDVMQRKHKKNVDAFDGNVAATPHSKKLAALYRPNAGTVSNRANNLTDANDNINWD